MTSSRLGAGPIGEARCFLAMQSGPPQLLRSSLHMAIADGANWSDIVLQNPVMSEAISERVRSKPSPCLQAYICYGQAEASQLLRLQLPVLKAAKLTEITGAAAAQGNVRQVSRRRGTNAT